MGGYLRAYWSVALTDLNKNNCGITALTCALAVTCHPAGWAGKPTNRYVPTNINYANYPPLWVGPGLSAKAAGSAQHSISQK